MPEGSFSRKLFKKCSSSCRYLLQGQVLCLFRCYRILVPNVETSSVALLKKLSQSFLVVMDFIPLNKTCTRRHNNIIVTTNNFYHDATFHSQLSFWTWQKNYLFLLFFAFLAQVLIFDFLIAVGWWKEKLQRLSNTYTVIDAY